MHYFSTKKHKKMDIGVGRSSISCMNQKSERHNQLSEKPGNASK